MGERVVSSCTSLTPSSINKDKKMSATYHQGIEIGIEDAYIPGVIDVEPSEAYDSGELVLDGENESESEEDHDVLVNTLNTMVDLVSTQNKALAKFEEAAGKITNETETVAFYMTMFGFMLNTLLFLNLFLNHHTC